MEETGGGTREHFNVILEEGEINLLWDLRIFTFELEVSGRGCTKAWKWKSLVDSGSSCGSEWVV